MKYKKGDYIVHKKYDDEVPYITRTDKANGVYYFKYFGSDSYNHWDMSFIDINYKPMLPEEIEKIKLETL